MINLDPTFIDACKFVGVVFALVGVCLGAAWVCGKIQDLGDRL